MALVTAVGETTPDYIKLGDKVLLDTMKWRRGVFAGPSGRRIWDIAIDDILVVDDDGLDKDAMERVANYLVGFDNDLYALTGKKKHPLQGSH